ncbi:MAG: hypothetical protein ACI8R4_001073 [Paracoccaceae bacterium]|jgi:hypothetical protein
MGLLVVAGLFFVVGFALESTTSWIAIRGAKKHHPELWIHSGQPTLMGNGDLMKAWPLVVYYHDRKHLETVRHRGQQFLPIVDKSALEFAEKLRGPLLYTYYAGWIGVAMCVLMFLALGILGYPLRLNGSELRGVISLTIYPNSSDMSTFSSSIARFLN